MATNGKHTINAAVWAGNKEWCNFDTVKVDVKCATPTAKPSHSSPAPSHSSSSPLSCQTKRSRPSIPRAAASSHHSVGLTAVPMGLRQ